MAQKFTNAARAALSASISATDTSLSVGVALADLFPVADTNALPVPTVGKDWFKLTLQNSSGAIEIVYVRTRALGTAVMSNVIRGQEGTTAIAFLAGSVVGLRHTAADLAGAVDLAALSSAAGKSFLTAASPATQRTALGASTIGETVFTAATPATAQAAIGAPALIQSQSAISTTTTGTATAFLASVTPALTSNAPNSSLWVNFQLAPGLNATLAVNGQAALPLICGTAGGTYINVPANAWQPGWQTRVTLSTGGGAWIVEEVPPIAATIPAPLAGFRNRVHNGNFLINQRAVTGSITLPSGTYGHDRWKAGSSGCVYTLSTSLNVTTINITSGTLQQVIEGVNLQSGAHRLSFVGTAPARIDAGSYGAGGAAISGTAVGGTNQTVEFGIGAFSLVQYEPGAVATEFEHRPAPVELAICQRYYEVSGTGVYQANVYASFGFMVTKRATPTVSTSASGGTYVAGPVVSIQGFYAQYNVTSGFIWTASADL